MKIKQVVEILENWCPPALQESYDNSGLLVGNPEAEVTACLVSLDLTEDIIQEAISNEQNLIICHHPIIFSGLKRLVQGDYVQRCVQLAIRHDINLYAMHTNLDNVNYGVNLKILNKLGLKPDGILAKKEGLLNKLAVYVPKTHASKLLQAIFDAGAGRIGDYDSCSFQWEGKGSFRPLDKANPFIGTAGKLEEVEEHRVEVLVDQTCIKSVLKAMFQSHPYEEVAYDLIALKGQHKDIGAGMIGNLESPMQEEEFFKLLQKSLHAKVIRHSEFLGKPIKRVAVCGGSGSFLIQHAISAGADVFITADYTYHKFFDADKKLVIADVGHFESEQFTGEIITDFLGQNFNTFAASLAKGQKNPVNYFI